MSTQTLVTLFILSPMIVVAATWISISVCNAFPDERKKRRMKKCNQCCKNCKHCILVNKVPCCYLSLKREWDQVEGFIVGEYRTCYDCVGSKICQWESNE